jgi:hypothetical protein
MGEIHELPKGKSTMRHQDSTESDLQTQFESLLDTVWECERQWALDDRLDLARRLEAAQSARQTGEL